MLKKIGNIILTAVLMLTMLLNGISHELVHSFLDHEDTTDCLHRYHENKEATGSYAFFDSEHHHCDFLTLCFSAFTTFSYLFIQIIDNVEFSQHDVIACIEVDSELMFQQYLRGPPPVSSFVFI